MLQRFVSTIDLLLGGLSIFHDLALFMSKVLGLGYGRLDKVSIGRSILVSQFLLLLLLLLGLSLSLFSFLAFLSSPRVPSPLVPAWPSPSPFNVLPLSDVPIPTRQPPPLCVFTILPRVAAAPLLLPCVLALPPFLSVFSPPLPLHSA